MATTAYTASYTIVDIRRVLGSFAADFGMMVQSAGLTVSWPRPRIENLVADLVLFAQKGYLSELHVALWNGQKEIRAARYTPSIAAYGWANQRPGGCIWPHTDGGTVHVVVVYSEKWIDEPDSAKAAFKSSLHLSWNSSSLDITHSGLVSQPGYRRYESNGYGLERMSYED